MTYSYCEACNARISWRRVKEGAPPSPYNEDGTSHFSTCPFSRLYRCNPRWKAKELLVLWKERAAIREDDGASREEAEAGAWQDIEPYLVMPSKQSECPSVAAAAPAKQMSLFEESRTTYFG